MNKLIIHADGLCEPNPGKGSWAFIVLVESGEVLDVQKGYLGGNVTNNYAEYTAVGKAARWCNDYASGVHQEAVPDTKYEIQIFSDSMLVVNQVNGVWQCHDARLRALRDRIRDLFAEHGGIALFWVKGTENKADILTRKAYQDAVGTYPQPRMKKAA